MGGTNTIDFDIPSAGFQTIAPVSPLPTITTPVVLDGTTQPGYAGAPLIGIVGQPTADADPLSVGSDFTLKGVAIAGTVFANVNATTMLAVESVPISPGQGGMVSYQIIVTADEDLVATAQAVGTATSLSLLDSLGQVVLQSDGLSAAEPIDAINIDLHRYVLAPGPRRRRRRDVHTDGDDDAIGDRVPGRAGREQPRRGRGRGLRRRWQARPGRRQRGFQHRLDPARQWGWHVPVGRQLPGRERSGRDRGGRLQRRRQGRPGRREWGALRHRLDPARQWGWDVPAPASYTVGDGPDAIAAGDFRGDGDLDLAIANSKSNNVSILVNNGDGTFRPAVDYPVGYDPTEIVAGDFTGDGRLDLAVTVIVGLRRRTPGALE